MRHIMLLCINEQSQPKHVAKLYKKVEAAKNASCERYKYRSYVCFGVQYCEMWTSTPNKTTQFSVRYLCFQMDNLLYGQISQTLALL